MNHNRFRLAWALVAASVFASCGGSDTSVGIDGTGRQTPIVSYGRLGSFGSIEINGVHFDTAGATFLIDGAVGNQADLKLGDIVFVEGRSEPGTTRGVAQRVISDHVLLGQIESIDTASQSFVALGQSVRVGDQTAFGPDIAAGLAALSTSDAISVSGFRNAHGAIIATRIDRQDAGSLAFKTTGALTNIDAANSRLQINGLVVDYSGATLLPADAASTLARGVFVEVKGAAQGAAEIFFGTSVEIKRQRLPGGADTRAKLEGYVTALDPSDATRFQVDGLPVSMTASTVREGTLTIDASATVAGSIGPAGTVVASGVQTSFSPPVGGNRIEGRVFDAYSGPIADASIELWVQTPSYGYSYSWATGGFPRSGPDGRFTAQVPAGSMLMVLAHKAGFVQPCGVIRDVTGDISFDVEMVALSTLDASNPPAPLSATGAVTVTGMAYEQTAAGRQPVAGARLWFGDSFGFNYATTVTDRDGRYLACSLPHDTRWVWGTELWAQKVGFSDTLIPVIDTSRSTVVDFEMRRP
jgi:hypothetical protein